MALCLLPSLHPLAALFYPCSPSPHFLRIENTFLTAKPQPASSWILPFALSYPVYRLKFDLACPTLAQTWPLTLPSIGPFLRRSSTQLAFAFPLVANSSHAAIALLVIESEYREPPRVQPFLTFPHTQNH